MSRDWLLIPLGRRELGQVLAASRHALAQLQPQLAHLTADAAGAERRGQGAIAAGLRDAREHVADVVSALEGLRAALLASKGAHDAA